MEYIEELFSIYCSVVKPRQRQNSTTRATKIREERRGTRIKLNCGNKGQKCIKMPFYGHIVVIRRSGVDGSIFPLVSSECLLGRAEGCDIRVQLPTVSREHCRISVNQSEQVSKKKNQMYSELSLYR